MLEIFDVLYPDEMVWVGCSTDCLNMVRFFAPASLWINLSQCLGISNPPPQKVQQHIEFLKSQLDSGAPLEENGVLAVVANTCSFCRIFIIHHFSCYIFARFFWKIDYF